MPRLPHGRMDITEETLRKAHEVIRTRLADHPLSFARVKPIETRSFDFLFRDLQDDSDNLLLESRETRDNLVALGEAMADAGQDDVTGDSNNISAAYTYFGQFVDHDITLDTTSATTSQLIHPDLEPLP